MSNRKINNARSGKKDEYYTQYEVIAEELQYYKPHFKDAVIYCNCDDHRSSNFVRYFKENFEALGLKKLISTQYVEDGTGIKMEYDGRAEIISEHDGDGDFRSPSCYETLMEADIVVTNPPFSVFREFLDMLLTYNKKFIIIGNHLAITCKDVYNYYRDGLFWFGGGINRNTAFQLSDDYERYSYIDEGKKYGYVNISWYTNLTHTAPKIPLPLTCEYSEDRYPTYDNYDAIHVDMSRNIPYDYEGVMGVPVTYLRWLDEDHYEVLGLERPYLNGKQTFVRLMIRKR